MKKKLLLSLLLLLLAVQNLNAEATSQNLLGLTKLQFKTAFEVKHKRPLSPKIWFNEDGSFCGNRDAEMFLDQVLTVMENTPLTSDPPFFLSPVAFIVYGVLIGKVL